MYKRQLHAAVGCCCLALSICAPEIIGFLAPLEYQEGIYVIPPVAASVMLMFLFNLFATIEYYFEETRAVMWASLTGAILNIALNYILLPQFGFVAAGYTTLACYAFFCIGHFILMRRALKIHGMQEDVYDVRGLCLLTVAFTCLILGIGLLYPFPIVRYGLIVAACIMGLAFRRRIMEQIGRISSIRRKG